MLFLVIVAIFVAAIAIVSIEVSMKNRAKTRQRHIKTVESADSYHQASHVPWSSLKDRPDLQKKMIDLLAYWENC